MAQDVSFSSEFEAAVLATGQFSDLTQLKTDLAAHLGAVEYGDSPPVSYLGRTYPFEQPASVVGVGLEKIHVLNPNCPQYTPRLSAHWQSKRRIHDRVSDTYFIYSRHWEFEHKVLFLGFWNPAHEKLRQYNHYEPLVKIAEEFQNS
jgi:hypothetical protein